MLNLDASRLLTHSEDKECNTLDRKPGLAGAQVIYHNAMGHLLVGHMTTGERGNGVLALMNS